MPRIGTGAAAHIEPPPDPPEIDCPKKGLELAFRKRSLPHPVDRGVLHRMANMLSPATAVRSGRSVPREGTEPARPLPAHPTAVGSKPAGHSARTRGPHPAWPRSAWAR